MTGNGIYCQAKKKTLSERATKRVNRCGDFDFNEIDAYDLESRYKERIRHSKQIQGQMTFEWKGV